MSVLPLSLTGLLYGVGVPVIALVLLALALIPASMRGGGRPEEVVRATYAYLGQTVGILLMSSSAIPTATSILSGQPFLGLTYTGLLLTFGLGGVLFLWQDGILRSVDALSITIPRTLFLFTWKFMGLMAVVLSALAVILPATFAGQSFGGDWWAMPIVFLVYGVLLMVLTHDRPIRSPLPFVSTSMKPASALPAKKLAASKKKRKK